MFLQSVIADINDVAAFQFNQSGTIPARMTPMLVVVSPIILRVYWSMRTINQ